MSTTEKTHKWKQIYDFFGKPNNFMLSANDFKISFNPHCVFGMGGVFDGDEAQETALIKDTKFYVLNGDHRKEYEKLIDDGYEVCKKYYDSQYKFHSKWTSK